jgi:ABC-2 type transport system ATP-binding protein
VRDVAVTGATLSCSVPATALDGLLRRMLAGRSLVDLECTEAGLEQTFLALYGGAGDRDAGTGSRSRS